MTYSGVLRMTTLGGGLLVAAAQAQIAERPSATPTVENAQAFIEANKDLYTVSGDWGAGKLQGRPTDKKRVFHPSRCLMKVEIRDGYFHLNWGNVSNIKILDGGIFIDVDDFGELYFGMVSENLSARMGKAISFLSKNCPRQAKSLGF